MNLRAALRQRFQKNRSVWMTAVVLILGLLGLGLIVGAQTIFAQGAYQPGVSIQSGLQADYSGQRHNTAVAQVGLGIIEDVLLDAQVGRADEAPNAISAAQRFATVQAALLTPVPTVTPNPTQLAARLTALASAPTATATFTAQFTATHTRTPSATVFPTETPLPTETPSATASSPASSVPTNTRPASTATRTATTVTSSATATRTNTVLPTSTRTATVASTATRTNTVVPSSTFTPSRTNTFTATRTNTITPSPTFSPTQTSTRTPTATATRTNTLPPSQTPTPTTTFTVVPSVTPSHTSTPSQTRTNTPTSTFTPTNTATATFTPSQTPTATFTATPTSTPTAGVCIPVVADGVNSLPILRSVSAIAVDGNLSESVWQVLYPIQNPASGSQFDNVGWFGMAWDSTNLYYGFKILDNQTRNDSTDPWQDDSIEAYLDGGNEGSTTYDGNDFGFVMGWNDSALYEQNGRIFGVQFASADVSGGYAIELAVPWALIGGTVTPGRIVGVDGMNNDDDNNNDRENQLAWTGTTNNHQDTSAFGDGILVDSCTPLPAGQTLGIGSFTLINADTDQPIAGFDPILPGATITLSALPTTNLNIRANFLGEPGSLKFGYEGNPDYWIENTEPFSIFGDASNNYDYNAGVLTLGAKTLTSTPYSGNGASGTPGVSYTLNFTVAN